MDEFSNSQIPSVHKFWRSLKTDSNVLWCQKLSVSIMFMICEMITGSYLCRFDSRGIKSIPSIIMFLYSSTTLCHSIIWCIWYCIKWFECTALAYKNFFSSSLIVSSSFIILVEISPSFISISIVHALCDSFLLSSSAGPCATNVDLLIDFTVHFSFIGMSLWL